MPLFELHSLKQEYPKDKSQGNLILLLGVWTI